MSDLRNTIDAEHLRTESLCETLISGRGISPRTLRGIWEARQRPFWRLNRSLYLYLARRLIEAGENYLAIDVMSEGKSFFKGDPDLLFQEALASARCGSIERARELLLRCQEIGRTVEDAAALAARLYKDAWKATGETRFLEAAFENYLEAYQLGLNPSFTGTNAASMALLLGRKDTAGNLARTILQNLETGRFSQGDPYWDTVTRAECQLVLGRIQEAEEAYSAAASQTALARANLLTARAQVRLLLPCHGYSSRLFDRCFGVPIVACFTGHRIDEPGREWPRFPSTREAAVSEAIAASIRDLNIGIGFSAAANGADILFLENLQAAGGDTFIVLPMDRGEFKRSSVQVPGSKWGIRFDDALAVADALYELEMPRGMADAEGFEYGNKICLGAAMRKARELDTDVVLLAVWDGTAGEQGGTCDFIRLAEERRNRVVTIDPMGRERASSSVAPTPHLRSHEWPVRAVAVFSLAGTTQHVHTSQQEGQVRLKNLTEGFQISSSDISVQGPFICVVVQEIAAAAEFALSVLRAASKQELELGSAIGLHAGPMRPERSVLTDSLMIDESLISAARDLAGLEAGYVYASTEFASLAELAAIRSVRFEYLGQQRSSVGGAFGNVFRVVPERLAPGEAK